MIPYYKPCITKRELKAANRVLRSGFLAQGPEVLALENEYSKYCGDQYCVAVSSATAGLYLVCKYMKLYHEWKEVNIPAYTFCATYQAAKAAGLNIKIRDVDDCYLLNEVKSKGNIFVDFAGTRKGKNYPSLYCGMNDFIVDSAHSFPREILSISIFSFYPTKPIASNGGGMIVTSDKELAEWCRKIRQHGRKESIGYVENPASIGFNFWMSDLNASIARAQLKKIDYLKQERKRVINKYLEGLKGYDLYYGDHLCMLRLESKYNREIVQTALIDAGIEYSRPYIPLAGNGSAPNAWSLYQRSIALPYYVSLTNGQIQYIVNTIRRAVE